MKWIWEDKIIGVIALGVLSTIAGAILQYFRGTEFVNFLYLIGIILVIGAGVAALTRFYISTSQ